MPNTEQADPVLVALYEVRDDLEERKELDVAAVSRARHWRAEIRAVLAVILLALLLLIGNAWQAQSQRRLLIDRFDRAERNRAAAKDDVVRHIIAANTCEKAVDPDVQACVDRMLPPTTTRPSR